MNAWQLFRPVLRATRPGGIAFQNISNYAGRTFVLNTGDKIPAIGFGTFQDKEQQEGAVFEALKAGYDTEVFIGNAIKKSRVPRNEILITTKLWCNSFHPDDVESALDDSLRDLQTDYIDLYLMHYICARGKSVSKGRGWPHEDGRDNIKAIGVPNFNKEEVENLIGAGKAPAVHQMEVHPFLTQEAFTRWHQDQGIHVQQLSPLGNQNSFYRDIYWNDGLVNRGRLIDEPILAEIGRKYSKSPAQVALTWGVNNGRSVIPKSTIP